MEKIEDLIKKFGCWRFWGYCLVASYQYYRICTTFRIRRLRWAGVHSELARVFPLGESTTPQEVLGRLSSRRRALRKIETWMTLHVELLFFSVTVEPSSVLGSPPPFYYPRRKRVRG